VEHGVPVYLQLYASSNIILLGDRGFLKTVGGQRLRTKNACERLAQSCTRQQKGWEL